MITSKQNSKIVYLNKLKQKKYRQQEQKFLVEGEHLVLEAKRFGVLEEAYTTLLEEDSTQVSKEVLDSISTTSGDVLYVGLCDMKKISNDLESKVLILDSVQDPGNIGTLMRSALAFGFATVFIGDGCVDIFNPKVIRASQGAIFKLNFLFGDVIKFIKTINKKDYIVYGTNVRNGEDVSKIKPNKNIAFILGNEGHGVSDEIIKYVGKNLYIPIKTVESLNVAIAGSIIMYELSK